MNDRVVRGKITEVSQHAYTGPAFADIHVHADGIVGLWSHDRVVILLAADYDALLSELDALKAKAEAWDGALKETAEALRIPGGENDGPADTGD